MKYPTVRTQEGQEVRYRVTSWVVMGQLTIIILLLMKGLGWF